MRDDCVMRDDRPHTVGTIGILDGILRRMAGHGYEKRATMRPLRVSFF